MRTENKEVSGKRSRELATGDYFESRAWSGDAFQIAWKPSHLPVLGYWL